MDKQTLKKKIDSLNPWFYPVTINGIEVFPGIGSTWNARNLSNRIKYRKLLLVDEVSKRLNLRGKFVLDLACNCGYWSAIYANRGIKQVVGVEGRRSFFEQAKLYWKYGKFLPIDKYRFIMGDVTDLKIWEAIKPYDFDITLCAGILYHIPNYKMLLNSVAGVTKEAIIIDTRVSNAREKFITEPKDLCFNAIKQTRKKIIPNLDKLLGHLNSLNFDAEILPVKFKTVSGLRDGDDYNLRRRVTILAKRRK
jgi:2-polyprenyl-3-methyl-5-hydroxy-6-metoxy-1,4-benzoquinol methylase